MRYVRYINKHYVLIGRLEVQYGVLSHSFTVWWHGQPSKRLWPPHRPIVDE